MSSDPAKDSPLISADVAQRVRAAVAGGADFDPQAMHPVLTYAEVDALVERSRRADIDRLERDRLRAWADRVRSLGPLRKVGTPDADANFEQLRLAQPHFASVLDFISDRFLLSKHARRAARIPPILLHGDAGVGKTYFSEQLAEAMRTTHRRVGMEAEQTNSTFTGSDRHWSNARPGLLFEMIVLGDHSNPVIVLDEIDKARTGNGYDPLGPLHSLLEPLTAARVVDACAEVAFDASLVTWVMTANDPSKIPWPLRSRMRMFHIQQPLGEDALAVAFHVVHRTLRRTLPGSAIPAHQVVVALAHLTAREIVQATEDALSAALRAGRSVIEKSDLPRWVTEAPEGEQMLH